MPEVNTLLDNLSSIPPSQKEELKNLKEKTKGSPKVGGKDNLFIYSAVVIGIIAILSAFFYAVSSLNYWKGKESVSVLNKNGENSKQKEDNQVTGANLGNVPSPINGAYTEKGTETIWQNRRPIGVMINNHVDARPSKCLSNADIVYEAVAEGGISRFLAVFQTKDCESLGPVRSARVYYEDFIAEYQGIYAHWGAAYQDPNDPTVTYPEADAYLKINDLNLPDLDQMWVGDLAYWREDRPGKATEHTGYTGTAKLWEAYKVKYPEADWRTVLPFETWKFKDDAKETERAKSGVLEFNFWESMSGYNVKWEYDPKTNDYKRFQGNEPFIDDMNGSQIRGKTIVVQFTKETQVGDKKNHLLYQTLGTGDAKIYLDGKEIPAKWSKTSSRSRTKYTNLDGTPIEFNRGQIWVEVVPDTNVTTYKTL